MLARDDTTVTGLGDWFVHLICCNLDFGYQRCDTWEEADTFRKDWTNIIEGHDRAGIIERGES